LALLSRPDQFGVRALHAVPVEASATVTFVAVAVAVKLQFIEVVHSFNALTGVAVQVAPLVPVDV
jgi:hypothetical protein